jgi:hypothetical protein
MDFIEQLFGIAPDDGDGTLEVLWVVAIVVTIAAIYFRKQILARWRRQR